jgi:hypothetical protein
VPVASQQIGGVRPCFGHPKGRQARSTWVPFMSKPRSLAAGSPPDRRDILGSLGGHITRYPADKRYKQVNISQTDTSPDS